MSTTFPNLHAYGYEGTVEEEVPVEEFHRARCSLCDWVSEEFDGLDWKSAEEAAVEHYEDEHAETDDDDDDEESE
jgi:hypothetical protein